MKTGNLADILRLWENFIQVSPVLPSLRSVGIVVYLSLQLKSGSTLLGTCINFIEIIKPIGIGMTASVV